MGGGRGAGFFAGTDGWRASEAFAKGTLVAAAAQNTATDAGGGTPGGMLGALRPWWSYPYGHPEKTKKIEMLQKALKPRAEQMGSGFINHPDAQDFIMKYSVKLLKEVTSKRKKGSKNK